MARDASQIIKLYLENLYDIPFDVTSTPHYQDTWFDIKPLNSNKELFSITVKFINAIRLIIEVVPEKYAAFSIQDMATAPLEGKRLFSEYAKQLIKNKAKTELYINDVSYDPSNPDSWPDNWSYYRLRVSRSPICAEDEVLDEAEIASSWAGIVVGMVLSLLNVTAIGESHYVEGGLKRVETNRYERNPVNRELCLTANGYSCSICGFDFEKEYGEIGHHYIHVHHIVPVSKMNESYYIDPVNDLIPVCPNCHSMLHRQDPPLLPEDLKQIIKTQRNKSAEIIREELEDDL